MSLFVADTAARLKVGGYWTPNSAAPTKQLRRLRRAAAYSTRQLAHSPSKLAVPTVSYDSALWHEFCAGPSLRHRVLLRSLVLTSILLMQLIEDVFEVFNDAR